jgi:hypothetical protein
MDDIYQIEDIPLTKGNSQPNKITRTLTQLEVDQSFLIPEPLDKKTIACIRSSAWNFGKNNNRKFAVRRFEGIGLRVGRLA